MNDISDILTGIVSLFKKQWPTITVILVALLSLIVKKIREFIINILTKYLTANFRWFWYCLKNRSFIISGYIKFFFEAEIPGSRKSLEKFVNSLNSVAFFSKVEGNLLNRGLATELKKFQYFKLKIEVVSAQDKIDDDPVDEYGDKPKEKSELIIKWDKIRINYREFKEIFNLLRQGSDIIRDYFVSCVVDKPFSDRRVFIEVYYQKDCSYSREIRQNIPLPDESITLTKYKNKIEISSQDIDVTLHYLPRCLVKEKLREIIKKHID